MAFCVSYTRILENFRPVADKGARAVAIFDGGFAERGDEGARLQSEIVGICRESNILLNGPNCMGVLNATDAVELRFRFYRELLTDLEPTDEHHEKSGRISHPHPPPILVEHRVHRSNRAAHWARHVKDLGNWATNQP